MLIDPSQPKGCELPAALEPIHGVGWNLGQVAVVKLVETAGSDQCYSDRRLAARRLANTLPAVPPPTMI